MTDLELKAALRQRLADMASGACGALAIDPCMMDYETRVRWSDTTFAVFGVRSIDDTVTAATDWLWERGVRA